MAGTNGESNGTPRVGTNTVKMGLAQMLKGGVIVSQFWLSVPRKETTVSVQEPVEARVT